MPFPTCTGVTDARRRQAELVLERKVSELESKKSSEELVHGEMARFLRDQKVSLSRDVDAWNARFKEDLDRKEDELKVGWVAIVASCSEARNLTSNRRFHVPWLPATEGRSQSCPRPTQRTAGPI